MELRILIRFLTCAFLCFASLRLPAARAQDPTSPLSLGPYGGWVTALAVAPTFASDGRAWVSVYGGRVFSTADGARSWSSTRTGESDPVVTGLAVSPSFATDHTLLAAADDGVFRSTDAGSTWQNLSSGLNGHSARAVAYLPSGGVLVATDGGVYRSESGSSWAAAVGPGGPVAALGVAQTEAFAAPSAGGLLASTDGGMSWSLTSFPGDRQVLAIAPSPIFETDGTVFVGTDHGIWVSRNRGASWQSIGLATSRVDALALSPAFASDHLILAGSASGTGVSLSSDGGATWEAGPSGYVSALAFSPNFLSDGTILAGTATTGTMISRDRGGSWSPDLTGLAAAPIRAVADTDYGVLACGTGGLEEGGSQGWTAATLPTPFINSCAAAGRDRLVATQNHGVLVSHDSGGTWSRVLDLPDKANWVSASPVSANGGVYLAAAGYVYRSADRGTTWAAAAGLAGTDVRRFRFSPQFATDRTVFAATISHGIARSTDGGASWTSTSYGLPGDQITDVLPSPTYSIDATVFAATAGDGVYQSVNGGASWTSLALQPPHLVVTALAWWGASLVAGTEKGLYTWNRTTWTPLSTSWDEYVTDLAVASRSGGLWIGTLGRGVWLLPPPSIPPTATIAPTASPMPPAVTPLPPAIHLKLQAYPRPLLSGLPALIVLRAPPGTAVTLSLVAGTWRRAYAGVAGPDGRWGIGFLAPGSAVRATATGRDGSAILHYHVTLDVTSPRSP